MTNKEEIAKILIEEYGVPQAVDDVLKAIDKAVEEERERIRKGIEELKYDDVNGTTREKAIFNDGLYQAIGLTKTK